MLPQKYMLIIKHLAAPVLFSLYPVVFLYAHNIKTLSLHQLYLPVAFSAVLAVVVFLLCYALMKNLLKASLASVSFLLLFWNCQLLHKGLCCFIHLDPNKFIFLIIGAFLIIVYGLWALKKQIILKIANKSLFIISLILFLFNTIAIITGEVKKSIASTEHIAYQSEISECQEDADCPDVFLLVFDEYARFDTIKEEWGYENKDFRLFLNKNNFFIASESRVPRIKTLRTLPELLNIRHFSEKKSDDAMIQLMYDNFLFSFFNGRGYDIHFLDGFNYPKKSVIPDYVTPITRSYIQGSRFNIFEYSFIAMLYKRSLLGFRGGKICWNKMNRVFYKGNLAFFDFLENTAPFKDSPKFIYAHVECPHLPFVFDREGNFVDWLAEGADKKDMYLDQYVFVTKKIKEIVTAILENNHHDAIIVLQSDHGPRPHSAGNTKADNAHKVLNAIYFPDMDYSSLYPAISPVNTMRVILNQYFGEHYELL